MVMETGGFVGRSWWVWWLELRSLQERQCWVKSSLVAKLILLRTGLEQGLFSPEKTQEEEASPGPHPLAFKVSLQAPCRCSQYLLGQLPGVAVGKEETNVFPLGF